MNKYTINTNLTIDWEGEHLENLNDFLSVRKEIGEDKPFTHFICPLYFLNKNKRILNKIRSAILPHDEVALHVHCYKLLVENAGVSFRTNHDYYLTRKTQGFFGKLAQQLKPTTGRGIPLSVYTHAEIEKIIAFAKRLLQEGLDIETITGFRAGGWIANNAVFKTLEKLKFCYDSSVVPPGVLSKGYNHNQQGTLLDDYDENYGIFNSYVSQLWGRETVEQGFLSNSYHKQFLKSLPTYATQPYSIGSLQEYPNNFGMSDFVDPQKSISTFFNDTVNLPKPFVANFGCHMEGDFFYKQKIIDYCRLVPESTFSAISNKPY